MTAYLDYSTAGQTPANPLPVNSTRSPTTSDVIDSNGSPYNIGRIWVNTVTKITYFYAGGGTWTPLSASPAGAINTITGDTGGAESPSSNNFNLLGTANQITVTGTAATETFSVPAVFIAPGSIASTTTLTAGSSLAVTTTAVIGTGLTVTSGGAAITGTTTINNSGAATTTIGTGGTGATNIGNATGNTAVTGSLTASTSLTATLGNITATNGNIVRGTAGNKDVYSSVATTTTAGANSAGTVALAGGTATVATTAVTASSQIRLYRQGIGATGAAALGILSRGTITAGVSFVINAVQAADATALQASDVSVIGWEIVN